MALSQNTIDWLDRFLGVGKKVALGTELETLETAITANTAAHTALANQGLVLKSITEWTWAGGDATVSDTATVAECLADDKVVVVAHTLLGTNKAAAFKGVRASDTTITLTASIAVDDDDIVQILVYEEL